MFTPFSPLFVSARTALFALAASVFALAAAYTAQYGFGMHPCELCYWQRVPYAAVILLSLAAMLPRVPKKIALWLCVAAFAVGSCVAAYHAGVEWRWWAGPGACSGGVGGEMTVEELRAKILGAAAVSCAEASFRFLGISMAGWNAVYSAGCAVIVGMRLKRGKYGN